MEPLNFLLLKLASRCNLDCTYCYWFRDKSVMAKPPLLNEEVEARLIGRLEFHIAKYSLTKFNIVFHGGEPLLFGKTRFDILCARLRRLEEVSGCQINLGITTNGVLLDELWAELFRRYDVGVTLSLDGPKEVNDKSRLTILGNSSFDSVLKGLQTLRMQQIEPSVLAVCDPNSDPDEILSFFVHMHGLKKIDILVPDATHEDQPISIATYYKKLFDLWFDRYSNQGVCIRYVENIAKGVLGLQSNSEALGYGPVTTATLLTDGSLEPLDVMRIAGTDSTQTCLNILSSDLQELESDPIWLGAYKASLTLSPICKSCSYKLACGGGYLPTRWSKKNRYNNPSVYCDDLKAILTHASDRVAKSLYVQHLP